VSGKIFFLTFLIGGSILAEGLSLFFDVFLSNFRGLFENELILGVHRERESHGQDFIAWKSDTALI